MLFFLVAMVMISERSYSCSSLNGLEVCMVFWIRSQKQSDISKITLGIRRDLPPGWSSHPSLCTVVRQSEFSCFIVSKIERKDTGMLLFFSVGIPEQEQAFLQPGARLDKGSVGWRDGSVPAIPTALGAGLMMMMKTLWPKWVTAGGRQELEAL